MSDAQIIRAKDAIVFLARLLADKCRKGFHGTIGLELNVQDGVIQTVTGHTKEIKRYGSGE